MIQAFPKPGQVRRLTPKRGKLTSAQKEVIRTQVYNECGGRCELKLHPNCIKGVLPLNGITPWDHWHLVHIKNKRMWGWGRENLCGGCWPCHLISVHQKGNKPVPQKP